MSELVRLQSCQKHAAWEYTGLSNSCLACVLEEQQLTNKLLLEFLTLVREEVEQKNQKQKHVKHQKPNICQQIKATLLKVKNKILCRKPPVG